MRIAVMLTVLALCLPASTGAAGRTIISLDGRWEAAQGAMDPMPARFDRRIPVPGLCDMAEPPFTEVGVPSGQREAFWYRRTFRMPGRRRACALLKVNKAQFGVKVWVNGRPAGEHLACFTPGWFDVSSLVRWGGVNTLVVRVGAGREAVPAWVPTNTDNEQVRWIPGIYDSVTLHLMDGPRIESVQAASRVSEGAVRVQVVLRGLGDAGQQAPVRVSIREWKSGRQAAPVWTGTVGLAHGTTRLVDATLKLGAPRRWSPEDPFLYVVRCETAGDSLEARFAMRELRFDPRTGRAILNGQPYFLRGTNFCMFRFFEDPVRGGLPWDRAWARSLLALGRRTFHWNAARVCIAPFPEFWYDIADEQGWLLQDEFPIWGFRDGWSQDELVRQFRDWMRERWNHPSLVIWDACNETRTPRTGQAIAAVRGLDLSDRPWEDGYSPRHRPDDPMEDHPYRFYDPGFRLDRLGRARGAKGGLLDPPVLINEYGWLWLNRDGTPTTLTEKVYSNNLGAAATPDERREFQAYCLAALTEYWRARRQAAGVLHFCFLTYSRPGGQTSDHFLNVRKLTLEPRFAASLRDAFAPLGVMIDDFTSRVPAGSARTWPILITNDLPTPQSGTVVLRLLRRGRVVVQATAPFSVEPLGQQELGISLPLSRETGKHVLAAELKPARGRAVTSRRNVEVVANEGSAASAAEGSIDR